MSPRIRRSLRRAAVLAVAAGAVIVVRRDGGSTEPKEAPPRPIAFADAGTADGGADQGEADEARIRLVETLGGARIDAPGLGAAWPFFRAYWRQMRGPWVRPTGVAGQLTTTLSLRTSRDEEQWTGQSLDGGTWTPDARVWNMNEGSYEQREAIFAPAPSTIEFALIVPTRARLRLAPAVAVPCGRTTVFDVSIVGPDGTESVVSETRLAPADSHRWHDLDLDLDAWSGESVRLLLRTSTDRLAGDEKLDHSRPAANDGGAADEEPSVPPTVSLALWGNPTIVAREPARLPYNVLWIVVDALRPDAAASMHQPDEDAARLAAPRPPLDALLPAMPGLMPGLDRLAGRGVRFVHAWSAASWTRPGTLAMLTGERSTELGIDTTAWILGPGAVHRYYASDPPLLPRLLRRAGAVTAAFVNNFFMAGYAGVGLDMGFERVTDYRYRTHDTAAIEADASAWLETHAADRFFAFVNFNSPHQPYDPPADMLARVPRPPAGPRDSTVRAYLGEAAKDDGAILTLLDRLDALHLTDKTLVVVTSDHGETLSAAHDTRTPEGLRMRFHHAVGNYEETSRIPIVMALPGVLDGDRAVVDRVRSIDIAPTILDAEGLEADPRMSGRSLLPLAHGQKEAAPRAVVTEGRASRAILWDHWHFIVRDVDREGPAMKSEPTPARAPSKDEPVPRREPSPARAPSPGASRGRPGRSKGDRGDAGASRRVEGAAAHDREPEADAGAEPLKAQELYDLTTDPGERHDVASLHPDVVAEMRARLAAAVMNVPAADVPVDRTPSDSPAPALHFRFAGAGAVHRISGTFACGDGARGVAVSVSPVGISPEAVRVAADGSKESVDFAIATAPDAVLGFDLRLDPPTAPLTWQLFLDDRPWPETTDASVVPPAVFVGPFGLPATAARGGISSDDARSEVAAAAFPIVDPLRDIGLFVTRDRVGESAARDDSPSAEAAREMQKMLEQWGYAHPKEATH